MTQIKSSDVKSLREKTGAGMMDCKKALVETNSDFEAAIDWLRKKGIAKAAKKSDRIAAEGFIGVKTQGNKGVIIELNSETDFVSRNEKFHELATKLVDSALDQDGNYDKIINSKMSRSQVSAEEEIKDFIAIIGENITFRRVQMLTVENGTVISYVHNATIPNFGKIGVLVALESDADEESLEDLGKKIAMHIAAMKPDSLNIEGVDAQNVEREKQIFAEQAKKSGKADNIIEKMVEGRIRKYYEEVVLLEQPFVMDNKKKIAEFIKDEAKSIGKEIKLVNFVRFELGEGIEQTANDFASEVNSLTK